MILAPRPLPLIPSWLRLAGFWALLPFRPRALRALHRASSPADGKGLDHRATLIFLDTDGSVQSTRTMRHEQRTDRLQRGMREFVFSHQDHDGAFVYRPCSLGHPARVTRHP